MSLRIDSFEDVTIVRFLDKNYLDESKIQKIGDELMGTVQGDAKVVLDFSGVAFISVALIGKLVLFRKKMQGANGRFVLLNVGPSIMEVFRITRLSQVFKFRDKELEAITFLNAPP